jgi:hypothetical protein
VQLKEWQAVHIRSRLAILISLFTPQRATIMATSCLFGRRNKFVEFDGPTFDLPQTGRLPELRFPQGETGTLRVVPQVFPAWAAVQDLQRPFLATLQDRASICSHGLDLSCQKSYKARIITLAGQSSERHRGCPVQSG